MAQAEPSKHKAPGHMVPQGLSLQGAAILLYRDRPSSPILRDQALGPHATAQDTQDSPLGPETGRTGRTGCTSDPLIPVQCIDAFYVPKEGADLFWLQQPGGVDDLQEVVLQGERHQNAAQSRAPSHTSLPCLVLQL